MTGNRCLVLLPGLACDEAVWAPQRQALAAHRDVVVPGYGELDSLVDMARAVLAQVAAPRFGRFALAGHSMGGRVALEVLRMAPERVERLALLDTGVDPLPPGRAGEQECAQRMALVRLAREQGMQAMARQWARGMVHPARLATPLFDEIVAMVGRHPLPAYEAQIAALLARPDASGVLAAAACPVLVACGRDDAWSPPERHRAMQALCPGSRLVLFDDCGHMCTLEQPAAVSRALAEWLDMPAA